ncbi:unnamed protein product [Absidia cylindrospora]
MALPNPNSPPTLGDPAPTTHPSPILSNPSTPSTHRSNVRTWAQVTSRQRYSLMHLNSNSTESDSNTKQVIRSHVWKPGQSPGSMSLDFSTCNITHQDVMILIKNQYPSRIAVVPFSQGTRRLVELNFTLTDPSYKAALNNGLVINDKLTIIPCVALDAKESESNIARLTLRRLPLLPETDLVNGLKLSLAKYGNVLDAGIFRDPKTQTYMGTGYAIINRQSISKPLALTHTISWHDSEVGFHATWSEMPPWCRYCHAEGHVVADCSLSRKNQVCWNCGKDGHRAALCPRQNYGKKARKVATKPVDAPSRTTATNMYDSLPVEATSEQKDDATMMTQQQPVPATTIPSLTPSSVSIVSTPQASLNSDLHHDTSPTPPPSTPEVVDLTNESQPMDHDHDDHQTTNEGTTESMDHDLPTPDAQPATVDSQQATMTDSDMDSQENIEDYIQRMDKDKRDTTSTNTYQHAPSTDTGTSLMNGVESPATDTPQPDASMHQPSQQKTQPR